MGGLLLGVEEDCGGVYIILNLSEKGSFIYLTIKNTWIYGRINNISEGRNWEEEKEGGKGKWEEAKEAAVSGHCLLSLTALHVIAWCWWCGGHLTAAL